MSKQKTSKGLHSATSSQVSEGGQKRWNLQDGAQIDLFGQEALPVSLSQSQESRKAQTMSDTCGPSGSGSSESASLQQYLESKLLPLSDKDGLIPCKKIWKQKTTPARRRYCQLQVSVLSTKETDSGSWPTPAARDGKDGAAPSVVNSGRSDKMAHCVHLIEDVSRWPTPAARDYKGVSGAGRQERKNHPTDTLPNAAVSVTNWPTPRASERVQTNLDKIAETGSSWLGQGRGATVSTMVRMIDEATTVQGLWATPNTLDYMAPKSEEALKRQAQGARKGRTFPCNLREQVDVRSQEIYADMASGTESKPSSAKTEKSAPSQLNPRFSLWLMGYPIEWARCAERVTPLSRKSRRK